MAEKKYKSIKVELDVDEMIGRKKEAEGWSNISEVLRDLFKTEEKVKNGELVPADSFSGEERSDIRSEINEATDSDSKVLEVKQKADENPKQKSSDSFKTILPATLERVAEKSDNPIRNYATLFQDVKNDREYAMKVISYMEKNFPKDEVNTLRWIAGLPEEGRYEA